MYRQPESPSTPPHTVAEYSPAERALLLRVAHDAIASTFERREISLEPPSEHLAQPRGAFTTIYHRGLLRGCVGYVLPVCSVYRTVAETARAAAFDDSRFAPLRSEELPGLQVSLSILSALKPIQPEQIEIGRHGLVITLSAHRGLLLPQVPVERNWDRETFLAQTCRKAGLPENAWRSGATIEAFTAEIFGDPGTEGK
ncbi:MAG TPA: AmmeMemoRadiSam system protein A [Terriglobales bacterium]|nr:AmmeMemoRadiSam system protein A [Terriglobales bacterium]